MPGNLDSCPPVRFPIARCHRAARLRGLRGAPVQSWRRCRVGIGSCGFCDRSCESRALFSATLPRVVVAGRLSRRDRGDRRLWRPGGRVDPSACCTALVAAPERSPTARLPFACWRDPHAATATLLPHHPPLRYWRPFAQQPTTSTATPVPHHPPERPQPEPPRPSGSPSHLQWEAAGERRQPASALSPGLSR